MKETKIDFNGQTLWLDWDRYIVEKNWIDKKEEEYWDYCFSGQRTIDLFGVEGAKEVVARQYREEERERFNRKKRGRE